MNIKYLPHTADIRMRIEAAELPLLFSHGLKGMAEILVENGCHKNIECTVRETISLDAADTTCLLIDFLSEALSLSYVHRAIFCQLDIIKLSDSYIHAEISGTDIHTYDEEIKAVTYHEAAVIQDDNGRWQTTIVFDI